MDFRGEPRFSGGSTVGMVVPDLASSWSPSVNDQAIWATEDEYRSWSGSPVGDNSSNSNSNSAPARSGNEPLNKKSRNSQSVDSLANSNRSKAIGRMFFKTKLCCKFRVGVCPYVTNCNFAHGIEELRRPPPNWQEIVAALEEERGVSCEQREEHQIPTITTSDTRGETQRSYKGRHCKKFYTEEGCPYGDNCTFLHDEQSRSRESVAISVSPTVGGGVGGSGGGYATTVSGSSQKPSNWKTRICNKWETTGNCPFGSKCHFAHGLAELHKYGGGLVDTETWDSSLSTESKQNVVVAAKATEITVTSSNFQSAPHLDYHHHTGVGVPSQRLSVLIQPSAAGQRSIQKWKGPDKISKIYGDWIDDIE